MTQSPQNLTRLCYSVRYQRAATAIEWLCEAFDFERRFVVPGSDEEGADAEIIAHAQLVCGEAMVMLGSHRNDEFGSLQTTPSEVGGLVTASPYVIIDDVDAHYKRALAAGAEITMPPQDQDYGGRLYSCRDLEGHLWSFGSYDPWADPSE